MKKHTLDTVIKEYLSSIRDYTEKNYFPCLNSAIACLRELSQDVDNESKVVQLDIEDNGTVSLPDDFLDYLFIGISVENNH